MSETTIILPATLTIGAYLLGSIATAVITCKIMGLPDPRQTGSGNPGATNVLRTGGKKAAIITLIGDMLKGLLPTSLAHLLGCDLTIVALVGVAAFLGHLYPVFFGFKGGKGVATALGVLLGLSPLLGALVLGIWIVTALALRYSSLAALAASLAAPFITLWLTAVPQTAILVGVMSALLWWRHRGNIQRLLNGEEGKIGRKA